MEKNFVDTALKYLSLNSQSYEYHLGFWKSLLKNFPSNKEKILKTINSRAFNWRNDSKFSEKFPFNPVMQAIAESEHIIDILYPNVHEVNLKNYQDPALFLVVVYEYFLKTKTYQEMLQLHPLLNRVASNEVWLSVLVKRATKSPSTLKANNFVQNCVLLFFEDFFFTQIRFTSSQLTAKQFWDLVAYGIQIPVSRIFRLFKEPIQHTVFDDPIIKNPILEFSSSGKLPRGWKIKYKDPNQLAKLTGFLSQLKNNPSFILLLNLR
jgi:hypothetical protein